MKHNIAPRSIRILLTILFYLSLTTPILNAESEIYENYIVIYGEGPHGQHPKGFDVITYTKKNAEDIAKSEISTYMSGMIYGYKFEYQVDNPVNKREEYFDLKPTHKLNVNDPNFTYRQYEISQMSIRVQGIYRLFDDQKSYMTGYKSLSGSSSQGIYNEYDSQDWDNRYKSFEQAVKNSILNYAKSNIKSRPETITGRLILRQSPKFYIVSGRWKVMVSTNIVIDEIKYQNSF